MSHPALTSFLRRWALGGKRPAKPARTAKLRLETIEDRLVPATLPTPVVQFSTVVGAGFDQLGGQFADTAFTETSAAADPNDPDNLVVVANNGIYMIAYASADGGESWTPFFDNSVAFDPLVRPIPRPGPTGTTSVYRLQDPGQDPRDPNFNRERRAYSNTSGTSVAFDRTGRVYTVFTEHNPTRTSGAVVMYAFDFDTIDVGGQPQPVLTTVDLDPDDVNDSFFDETAGGFNSDAAVLYRWLGADPALNPVVAADNNTPSFTDPETGQTVIDTLAGKAVYVAWNTNANLSVDADRAFQRTNNPNTIQVVGSSDNGLNFSTPVQVSDFSYYSGPFTAFSGAVLPQITFAPATLNPDGTTTDGRVVFSWQTVGRAANVPDAGNQPIEGVVYTDSSAPDNGVANRPAVTASGSTRIDLGVPIADGLTGTPNVPVTTLIPFTLDLQSEGNLSPTDVITDLNVTLAVIHPNIDQVRITLTSPLGDTATLLVNRTDAAASPLPPTPPYPGLPASANLGVREFNPANPTIRNIVGTTFDDEAPRSINEDTANGSGGGAALAFNVRPDIFGNGSLSDLYLGRTAADLSGEWVLSITDFRNNGDNPPPSQRVVFVDVQASGYINNGGFGADQQVDGVFVLPTITDGNGTRTTELPAVSPVVGLGSSTSFAVDTTSGAFSPYAGRLYSAYTEPIYRIPPAGGVAILVDTDVFVKFSDDGGRTWSEGRRLSDDNALSRIPVYAGPPGSTTLTNAGEGPDNFSDGGRWQFQPTIAVDPTTGTVVATWYDARNDASNGRVATYIATSIDGGRTFSSRFDGSDYNDQVPSNQTWLNPNKIAIDAVTGQTVVLEPIPSNVTAFNLAPTGPGVPVVGAAPRGLGQRQTLLVSGGRVNAIWTGNRNAPGTQIFSTRATIAAGPRVVAADSGPVIADATRGGQTYNDTFAPDGTRRLDGFSITFDRPIDPASFTAADVEVRFRGAATQLSVPASRIDVLDPVALSPTTFFVRFAAPQSAVGTYSYAVGPNVTDRVRTLPGGNRMDQNANGVVGEAQLDRFSNPRPLGGVPFTLPYAADSLPLVIPGPRVVGSAPVGQPDTADNRVLNAAASALDVTFDRDVLPSSFTPGNILRITGPAGEVVGNAQFPITVSPVAVSPLTGGARTFRITFPPQVVSGGYTIELGPDAAGNSIRAADQPRLTANLPDGAVSVVVTFDRDITRAVTPADVVRVTGPNGPVAGSVGITAVDGNPRRFVVTFPAGPAGQYVFEFADDLRVPAAAGGPTEANLNPVPALDTNTNAGVDVLRGGNPDTGAVVTRSYRTPVGPGVEIPAATPNPGAPATPGVAELDLVVPDEFLLRQVLSATPADRRTIQLTLNVLFPNVPDLRGELVAPDGTTILLFDGPGTQGDPNQNDFAGTTFDDTATTPISTARPPFNPAAGTFNPQEPFGRLVERPQGPASSRGTWTVRITNRGTRTGTLQNFTLTLPGAVSGTGLGEPVVDRASVGLRVFAQDPSDPLSRQTWTPVGPASQNNGGNTGRVTGLAVDPSDPSGNTVYAGGASGGIWKTTNFLTNDPIGPDWAPLTDFGPTFALNIGSIAVFGRNNDTTRSVIVAATGEGDVNGVAIQGGATVASPGVGFLISVDGGRSWRLLDSLNNIDGGGNYLPIDSPDRDRRFVGTTAFKVVIDPTPTPSGDLIIYAALSDNATRPAAEQTGGIYRSNDTGRTWTLVRAGQATDVFLAAGSAPSFFDPEDPNLSRNLQIMYAAFRGEGVFFSPQAPNATSAGGPGALTRLDGGGQNPLFRDIAIIPPRQIPIALSDTTSLARSTPSGNKGRITLAGPALTNDVIQNVAYQGWLYALVAEADDSLNGLYMTKDFGRNWTRVRLSSYVPLNDTGPFVGIGYGSNDVSGDNNHPEYDPVSGGAGSIGNFAQSLAVDPNNPNVVYLGGSNQYTDRDPLRGFLQVDTTRLEDTQAVVAYNNSLPNTLPEGRPGGGPRLQFGSPRDPANADGNLSRFGGSVVIAPYLSGLFGQFGPGGRYGIFSPDDLRTVNTGYLNVFRNPNDPFNSDAALEFGNIDSSPGAGFQNRGFGARIRHIDAEVGSNVHRIITTVDPLTGKTRLIVGDDQGVASAVASGDGSTDDGSVGFAVTPSLRRNGDLQIGQFYYGASQPSQLAADIAGVQRLFYATSNNNGFPASTNTLLQDGGTRDWTYTRTGTAGAVSFSGTGVGVDQTGSGLVYEYRWPGPGTSGAREDAFGSNFFRVIQPGGNPDGVGRTNGLVQDRTFTGGVSDNPLLGIGQWPATGTGANFAVNPINRNAVVMSAPGFNQGTGRLFRTTDQGVNWFVIGETPQVAGAPGAPGQFGPGLDGTYAAAVAFGSPNPAQPTLLDNFIYAGTSGGSVFVTRTGTGPWLNITAARGGAGALDGSAVQQIVANPRRGETDAFAVTLRGVYYKADAFDTSTGWVNITGRLFEAEKAAFPAPGNTADTAPTLRYLTTIAADWRYTFLSEPGNPQSPTFPRLYVGGEGGVFRSDDFGANWDYYPAASTYTDVDTGVSYDIPAGGYLPNVHVTDLDLVLGTIDPANGLPAQSQTGGLNLLLATTYGRGSFAVRLPNDLPPNSFVPGPRVARLIDPNPAGGPATSLQVVFTTGVDPTSFSAADVSLTDAAGNRIAVTQVQPVVPAAGVGFTTTFNVFFTPIPAGTPTDVTVVIGANPAGGDVPLVSDFGGNLLNQNNNLVNGEPVVDQYRTTIRLSSGVTTSRLTVVTSPAAVVAGVPAAVRIEARDANDQLLTGVSGPVTLTPANGGTFSPTQVTLVNGVAEFPMTFQTAGANTVLVAFTGGGDLNPTAFTTQVAAAAPTQFVLTPATAVVTVTAADPTPAVTFAVQAFDQFGNAARYTGPVTVTASGAAAELPEEPVRLENGQGSFAVRFSAQGTVDISVSGDNPSNPGGPPLVGAATVVVNAGTAARLEVTVPAGPFVVGDVVPVTVRAIDAAGNTAAFNGQFVPTIGDPAATFDPARPSFVNGQASFTVTVRTPGTYQVVVNAGALSGASNPLTVLSTPPRPPLAGLPGRFAVGTGVRGSPVVQGFNPNGTAGAQFLPFPPGFNSEVSIDGPGFTGGLRVAVADVTGDGVPDTVVGTGPGITSIVQVVDGVTNEAVQNIQPFGDFKGGVFVAVGDITGDGIADIVITPDEGGGPRVQVLRGGTFARVADFFGIADPAFRGGARAAVGDINADGFADLVVAAGFGGGPRVSILDGAALSQGRFVRPVGDFFVFEEGLRNGTYVAVGDVTGDGFADLIAGGGPGGAPRVLVLDGRQLLTTGVEDALAAPVANFFAGDTENRGGVRLAAKNLDGDRFADIVTGAGEGGGSGVAGYSGLSLVTGGADPLFAFDALADYTGGVYVG